MDNVGLGSRIWVDCVALVDPVRVPLPHHCCSPGLCWSCQKTAAAWSTHGPRLLHIKFAVVLCSGVGWYGSSSSSTAELESCCGSGAVIVTESNFYFCIIDARRCGGVQLKIMCMCILLIYYDRGLCILPWPDSGLGFGFGSGFPHMLSAWPSMAKEGPVCSVEP